MSLVSEVQALLDDTSGVFWTAQHVYDSLNQAELEIWPELRHEVVTATVTATASQEFISIPSSIMIPQRILNLTTNTGKELYNTTHAKLEQDNRNWRNEGVGETRWYVLFDSDSLMLWPRPSATTVLQIWGIPYPTEIIVSGTTTTTDITERKLIKKAIVYRAAAMIAQMTRPDLFELWMNESQMYLHEAQVELRNRQSHRAWRVKPTVRATTRAHMGSIRAGRRN